MYALVDCNNFFASCERVFNPALNNRPVVILSNNDGCVIARSNEAKALGIPMCAPAFKYEHFFEANRVHVFSANFPLYGDMSHRIMNILSEYSEEQEIYSIDECFLNLSSVQEELNEYGLNMRQRVLQWTGVPVSVGIAPTKSLAKLANRIAKKFVERTKGTYVIDTEEKRVKALKWLPVEDVWGIGRRSVIKLKAAGVHTAYDFTQLSREWVLGNMTIVGARLQDDLKGTSSIPFETQEKKQSISITRTFEIEYHSLAELTERVTTFAMIASESLRKQQSLCQSVMVFIETSRFREFEDQYSNSIVVKLPFATCSSVEIMQFVLQGLKTIYKSGYQYKRAGVVLLDFVEDKNYQKSLFFNSDPKHTPLMSAIDKLNSKFGTQKIRLASQDVKTWKMKQERLSRHFTTDLDDIIEVKV